MLGLSLALTGCGAANSAKGETKVEQQATSQPATPDATTKTDVDKENTTTGNTVNNQETNNTTTNISQPVETRLSRLTATVPAKTINTAIDENVGKNEFAS